MFSKILNALTTKLYVEISEEYLRVVNLKTGFAYTCKPLVAVGPNAKGDETILAIGDRASLHPNAVNPFSHPRVIMENYKIAELLIRYAFEEATQKRVLFAPVAIVKNLREMSTPLTDIEKVALCEMCTNAGAREAIVLENNNIDVDTMAYEALKQNAFCCNDRI